MAYISSYFLSVSRILFHQLHVICAVQTLVRIFPAPDDLGVWWIWGYWTSPMMYAANALGINEFLDSRWSKASFLFQVHNPSIFLKISPPVIHIIYNPWFHGGTA